MFPHNMNVFRMIYIHTTSMLSNTFRVDEVVGVLSGRSLDPNMFAGDM